ncbi:chromosomal organization and DNA repair protein Mms21, putative [Trichophyton verrucosum HKI 0517]|uniref:Chromosomal organization and DNA repair protein Mms21, putative n=1 Tax=Trichophyton verrucosum (strain HKI 0517) TaxID=663202 RepID=D4D0D9_TRIVH|nr:chromosomal organization and DNA repair protein Mms21, putative [Trichophyton verrucosum HKI 0517]EFE44684.1 chromosomal organization and DNA repair protein Mms21, putative [Trichophyton verrucosum HKI 0517]
MSRTTQRASTSEAMGAPLELPPYEPQIAPLTANAKRKVDTVIKSFHTRHLKIHLSHATGALSDSVGDTNDRLTEAKGRLEKLKRRRREREERRQREAGEEKDNEPGDRNDSSAERQREAENFAQREEKLAQFELLVKNTTERLEGSMRSLIDTEVQADKMLDLLSTIVAQNSEEGPTKPHPRARRARRYRDEEDSDADDDEQGEEAEPPVEVEVIPASRTIADGLAEKKREWESLSLAQRQFYRVLHESKYSAMDVPPLPHPSTWFKSLDASRESNSQNKRRKKKRSQLAQTEEGAMDEGGVDDEGLQPSSSGDENNNESEEDDDNEHDEDDEEDGEDGEGGEEEEPTREDMQDASSDDEVMINSEKFSITCPLTLQPFNEPVSSTKCPHSFERSAIESMLNRSRQNTFVPLPNDSSRGRNIRCVKCPVCNVLITMHDLKRDPVLIRRVKKAIRMAAAEAEENNDEDGGEGEDLEMDEDDSVLMRRSKAANGGRRVVVKSERTRSPSRIPDTQME